MSHDFIKLTFRNDCDGTGKLSVEGEGRGFAGRSGAYFDVSQVQDFARAIGEFPLPDSRRCAISSGFWSRETPGELDQEHVGIEVYPIDGRGHLGVQVRLSTEVWQGTRSNSQKSARFEIITTYQPLADFSRDLLALMSGTAAEAILRGETLS